MRPLGSGGVGTIRLRRETLIKYGIICELVNWFASLCADIRVDDTVGKATFMSTTMSSAYVGVLLFCCQGTSRGTPTLVQHRRSVSCAYLYNCGIRLVGIFLCSLRAGQVGWWRIINR